MKFQKQSWVSVFFLTLITFGIYLPFWFKKIKNVTDVEYQEKKLNGGMLTALMITSWMFPFFCFTLTIGDKVFTTNIYGIGDILNLVRSLLVIFLAFDLRKILSKKYSKELNAVLTFFFGPLYLQHKINTILEEQSMSQIQPKNTNPIA